MPQQKLCMMHAAAQAQGSFQVETAPCNTDNYRADLSLPAKGNTSVAFSVLVGTQTPAAS